MVPRAARCRPCKTPRANALLVFDKRTQSSEACFNPGEQSVLSTRGGLQLPLRERVNAMRAIFVSLAVVVSLGVASSVTPARADADDAAWIKKCVNDNKREGATADVVAAWCSCMNNKMSSNETLSITAWEKTHPAEVAACDKESGWK
jgi:hypothetical protein